MRKSAATRSLTVTVEPDRRRDEVPERLSLFREPLSQAELKFRSVVLAVSALRNIRVRVREHSIWIPLPDPRVQSPQVEIQIVVPDIAIAEKSLRNRETIGHSIFDRYKPTPSVRGGRIDQDLGVFQIESIVDKTRVEVVPSLSRHKKTDVNVAGRLGLGDVVITNGSLAHPC